MKRKGKKLISVLLAVLMAVTGIIPAASAFAGDGVEGYWDIELFYKDTDTMVPSYVDETAEEKQVYVETMKEGEKLNLTYKLIDTEMPDNGYINGTAICRLWLMLTKTVWLRHLTHQRVR